MIRTPLIALGAAGPRPFSEHAGCYIWKTANGGLRFEIHDFELSVEYHPDGSKPQSFNRTIETSKGSDWTFDVGRYEEVKEKLVLGSAFCSACWSAMNITPNRWFRWSLRTMFVMVTLLCAWLGWNAHRVRQRNDLIEYLSSLEHQQNPVPSWVIKSNRGTLPVTWRWMGAKRFDFATGLLSNHALTDSEMQRARSLLPDCQIEVHEP
jgi:hypothetical protein